MGKSFVLLSGILVMFIIVTVGINLVLAIHDDKGAHTTPFSYSINEFTYFFETDYVRYEIPTKSEYGIVNDIRFDEQASSLILDVDRNPKAQDFEMDISFALFEPSIGSEFFILADGEEIDSDQIELENHTQLNIIIPENTKQLEIIPSFISEFSTPLKSLQIIHDPPYSYILSPLKQMKEGIIPEDVVCKPRLTLMIRSSGDTVACVKPESVSTLTLRGWNVSISANDNSSNDTVAIAPQEITADIVFNNGTIYTVNPENPWAESVAITDKKITFVGNNNEVDKFVSDGITQVINLDGKMMLPGFHDTHIHPLDMGLALTRCNLFDLFDKELYLEKIAKCAQEQSDEEFVIGMGFLLPDYDPYSVTKEDLDEIISDKPALFMDMDGHSVWVNSKMLELAGIDRYTSNPQGGIIIRDPDTGEPTGLFLDDAMFLVDFLFFEIEPQESYEGATQALAMMSSGGITSFVEAMTFEGYEELFREMDSNGDLNFRVNLSLWVDSSQDDRAEQLETIKEQYSNDKSSHVRANMVKFFIDQGMETQTGSVFEPYYDKEGNQTENYGLLGFDHDDLIFYVTELEKAEFQIHIHAVGDNAIRIGLDALEESRNTNNLSDTRNTMAHVYLVHPDDVPRFAELDVIPNYQAFWAYKAEGWYEGIESSLGPERAETLFPFADLHNADAKIVLGSDWPVTTYEPLKIIEVGMTRQDPYNNDEYPASSQTILNKEQRLDLEMLIEAYTINGAYLMQQEDITGSVEVGKYADLVVLEKNLFEITPSEIGEVKVMMTFFEGKQVFNGNEK